MNSKGAFGPSLVFATNCLVLGKKELSSNSAVSLLSYVPGRLIYNITSHYLEKIGKKEKWQLRALDSPPDGTQQWDLDASDSVVPVGVIQAS